MRSALRDSSIAASTSDNNGAIGRSIVRLYMWNVLLMGLLGLIAMVTAIIRTDGAGSAIEFETYGELALGFTIGCIVGIMASMIVTPILLSKKWRIALLYVYIPSAVVVIVYTSWSRSLMFPLDSALPAFLSVMACSVIAAILLPDMRPAKAGVCGACGYDLRGHVHQQCPECGKPLVPNASVSTRSDNAD